MGRRPCGRDDMSSEAGRPAAGYDGALLLLIHKIQCIFNQHAHGTCLGPACDASAYGQRFFLSAFICCMPVNLGWEGHVFVRCW